MKTKVMHMKNVTFRHKNNEIHNQQKNSCTNKRNGFVALLFLFQQKVNRQRNT
tara:strand:- start:2624 stop:2782 length:159 start_codon:yes stop_codon:yes gene_type:complete